MHQPLTVFEVHRWHTFGFSINSLCNLDLWPRPWCALLHVRWATFLPILVFLGLFYWLMGQHLSHRPCDLATLTFKLWGHGACGWYRSSCFICVPWLNFVGLPVWKIWHTFGLILNRLGDLDLLTLKLAHNIARGPWEGQPSYGEGA